MGGFSAALSFCFIALSVARWVGAPRNFHYTMPFALLSIGRMNNNPHLIIPIFVQHYLLIFSKFFVIIITEREVNKVTELKGVENLNSKMTALLNNGLGTDIDYIIGADFCFWSDSDSVQFSPFMMNDCDNYWRQFLKNRFKLNIEMRDMWIFSVLHEVGHYHTLDDVSDFNEKYSRVVKWVIEKPFVSSTRLASMIYFALPDEIVATAWAVRFYKKHRLLCQRISEQAFGYIREFLDENGVTE